MFYTRQELEEMTYDELLSLLYRRKLHTEDLRYTYFHNRRANELLRRCKRKLREMRREKIFSNFDELENTITELEMMVEDRRHGRNDDKLYVLYVYHWEADIEIVDKHYLLVEIDSDQDINNEKYEGNDL